MAGFHPKHIYYPYQQTGSDWSYHDSQGYYSANHCSYRELLPLIVNQGYHHVPIVDADGLLGMVFQSRLLSTLFNAKGFKHNPRK